MARKVVLSDASPLIALATVGGLAWLHRLFGRVSITATVHREVVSGKGQPGAAEIAAAVSRGWLKVIEDPVAEPGYPELDEGEASILRTAARLKQPCLIIMDERAGRAVARQLGFRVTGVVGIIVSATRHKLIPAAKPVFADLLKNGFRLSPELVRAALNETAEE